MYIYMYIDRERERIDNMEASTNSGGYARAGRQEGERGRRRRLSSLADQACIDRGY